MADRKAANVERLRIAKLQADALFEVARIRLEKAQRDYKQKRDHCQAAINAYISALESGGAEGLEGKEGRHV